MERLTERDEFGNADIIGVDSADLQLNLDFDAFNRVTDALNRLAAYEDTGLEPEEIECNKKALQLFAARPGGDRTLEIAKAEQEGRLVVLPCKVGDTVYICNDVRGIRSENVRTFFIGHPSYRVEDKGLQMIRSETCDIPFSEIGKTVFHTREEAEKAMEAGG